MLKSFKHYLVAEGMIRSKTTEENAVFIRYFIQAPRQTHIYSYCNLQYEMKNKDKVHPLLVFGVTFKQFCAQHFFIPSCALTHHLIQIFTVV